jgi:hypothetical protein
MPRVARLALALLTIGGCMEYRTPMLDPEPRAPQTGAPTEPQADAATEPREDAGSDPPADRAFDLRADAAPTRDTAADVAPDTARDLPRDDRRPDLRCFPGELMVLVLGADAELYRLDTETLALTPLAAVSCGTSGLNSMTTSPAGPIFISGQRGDLCRVDLPDFAVSSTGFNPAGVGRHAFGMALLPDTSSAGQSLFIAAQDAIFTNLLYRIDLATYALTEVGPILPVVPWAELTAGPNGELYGFSIDTPSSLLLDIDPQTGAAIDVTSVPAGYDSAAFALVYWQDAFYLFVAPSSSAAAASGLPPAADVYRYRKNDPAVSHIGSLPVGIIGAGVTTCP